MPFCAYCGLHPAFAAAFWLVIFAIFRKCALDLLMAQKSNLVLAGAAAGNASAVGL